MLDLYPQNSAWIFLSPVLLCILTCPIFLFYLPRPLLCCIISFLGDSIQKMIIYFSFGGMDNIYILICISTFVLVFGLQLDMYNVCCMSFVVLSKIISCLQKSSWASRFLNISSFLHILACLKYFSLVLALKGQLGWMQNPWQTLSFLEFLENLPPLLSCYQQI